MFGPGQALYALKDDPFSPVDLDQSTEDGWYGQTGLVRDSFGSHFVRVDRDLLVKELEDAALTPSIYLCGGANGEV
jgi:hypothetical protein